MTRACLGITFWGLLVIPAFVHAQDLASPQGPSTRPARPFVDRREAQRVREGLRPFNPGANANMAEPLTPQDEAEIEQFMKTNSPKRWDKLQDVPDGRKDKIMHLIRSQIRGLQRMKEEDPKIYDIRMKRLPIEDEMFAIGWQLKHEDNKNPAAVRSALREKVRQFVDSSLEERRVRLEKQQERVRQQQQTLANEETELKRLSENKEALVERGAIGIENERGDALKDLAAPHKPRDGNGPATEPSADGADSGQ